MQQSPAIFFIKTHVQHYINAIVAKEFSVKKPLFYADAFPGLSIAFRQSNAADHYNFSNEADCENFTPLGLADSAVTSCSSYEQWFQTIDRQPEGLIIATTKDSIKHSLMQTKHDVLVINKNLEIFKSVKDMQLTPNHKYSFINFESGNIFHVFTTLDIPKHQFVFSSFKAEEKTRVARKAETHQRNYSEMNENERRIVGSSVLNELCR